MKQASVLWYKKTAYDIPLYYLNPINNLFIHTHVPLRCVSVYPSPSCAWVCGSIWNPELTCTRRLLHPPPAVKEYNIRKRTQWSAHFNDLSKAKVFQAGRPGEHIFSWEIIKHTLCFEKANISLARQTYTHCTYNLCCERLIRIYVLCSTGTLSTHNMVNKHLYEYTGVYKKLS